MRHLNIIAFIISICCVQVIKAQDCYEMVQNSGFELNSFVPYKAVGNISIDSVEQSSGKYCARLNGNNTYLSQWVRGLQPNTAYIFSVWIKTQNGEKVTISVQNYGGAAKYKGAFANEYNQYTLNFTTGVQSDSAFVRVYKFNSGPSQAWVDDYSVLLKNKPEVLVDGSFENESWNLKVFPPADASFVYDTTDATQGITSLQCNVVAPTNEQWRIAASQETYLNCDTDYFVRFKAKANVDSSRLKLAIVKGAQNGNPLTYYETVNLNETWKEYSISFRTGNFAGLSTSSNIKFWYLDAGKYHLDEVQFVQKLPPDPPVGENWHLVFEDEFDSTSLNPRKWVRQVENRPSSNNTHLTKWTSEASSVRDGKLVIKTSDAGYSTNAGLPVYYSGAISSRDKFNAGFGYYESRIRFMQGAPGVNGAFWLMSSNVIEVDGSGQDGTEIDILENPWHTGKMQHALHWDGYSSAHEHENYILDPNDSRQPGTWHVVSLLWTPEEYIFYVDGIETWRTSAGGVSQVKDAYVLFSSNVVSPWGGDINPLNLPVEMEVDYVRVYSLNEKTVFTNENLASNSFETENWGFVSRSPAKADFSYTESDVIDGERALQCIVHKVDSGNSNAWKIAARSTLNLKSNTEYNIHFKAKSNVDGAVLKSVTAYSGSATTEKINLDLKFQGFNISTDWKSYKINFTTTDVEEVKDQTNIIFRFTSVATYWIDSIYVVEKTEIAEVTDPKIYAGILHNADDQWEQVYLPESYQSMVVVATPHLKKEKRKPVVTRIRNATGNSFEIKLQHPGDPKFRKTYDISYMVCEVGSFTKEVHGIKLEAYKVASDSVSRKKDWNKNINLQTERVFVEPIVLGQVMSTLDDQWSVFWSSHKYSNIPVVPDTILVGRHIGEDKLWDRIADTLGVIVIEAGLHNSGNFNMLAASTGQVIKGIDNKGKNVIKLDGLEAPFAAVASQSGMRGANGSWPVLFGNNPLKNRKIQLAVDEDQIKDEERKHKAEVVHFIAFAHLNSDSAATARLADESTVIEQELVIPENSRWMLWPQPATGYINVGTDKNIKTDIHYQIVDLQGKRLDESRIKKNNVNGNRFTINTSKLRRGLYLLKVELNHKHYAQHIIIN